MAAGDALTRTANDVVSRTRSFTVRQMPPYRVSSGTANRASVEYVVDERNTVFVVPARDRVFDTQKNS
jgi:hypothetical protein